ncbi:MAG: restriction endonuclease [bacterium]|nr:restriction endonuclease [bacterium]
MAKRYYRRRSKSNIPEGVFVLVALGALVAFYTGVSSSENLLSLLGVGLLIAVLGAVLFAVVFLYTQARQSRLFSLEQIDTMNGFKFEHYVARLLTHQGYSDVRVTKAEGDFGADITVSKDGQKIAIQVKRYSYLVGVEAIYQVLGGRDYYKCDTTMVITNNYFTHQAIELAKRSGTVLINRKQLAEWIGEYRSEG